MHDCNQGEHAEAFRANLPALQQAIRKGVYSNLYKLLRDHLTEETYMNIVKNQILVDIQV